MDTDESRGPTRELRADDRERDARRAEKVRDISVIGGHDLSREINSQNDNGGVNDVVRLRACEQPSRFVSIGLSELGDDAATQKPS